MSLILRSRQANVRWSAKNASRLFAGERRAPDPPSDKRRHEKQRRSAIRGVARRLASISQSPVADTAPDAPSTHKRRRRYPGKNPREFHDKYKELNPEQYPAEVQKVLASGRTPAGTHLPIMVDEVLGCLRPVPGDVAVDCTLGGGGHARAILECVQPGGRLIGLDVDPLELPRAEAHLRAAGFGPDAFVARHANFAGLPKVLAAEGVPHANVILAD